MNKKNTFSSLLLSALACFVTIGCKDPIPQDPCANLGTLPKADFSITRLFGPDKDLLYDTVYLDKLFIFRNVGTRITFTALGKYDSVRWTIGVDPTVYVKPSFEVDFDYAYGRISTKMIGYRRLDKRCFPTAPIQIDTIVKSFFLADPERITDPLLGNYKGYIEDNKLDTFTVNINYSIDDPSFYPPKYLLKNLPKGNIGNTGQSAEVPLRRGELIFSIGKYFWISSGYGFGFGDNLGYVKGDSLIVNFFNRRRRFVGVRVR
jgi:hypothetical protein